MSLTDKQKSWILSFPTRQKLTSALNLALKEHKIEFHQLKEIFSYYNSTKSTENKNKLL